VLFPAPAGTWPDWFRQEFLTLSTLEELFVLIPPLDFWYTPFEDWTDEHWQDKRHLCVLYDNRTGRTLACHGEGVVSRERIRKSGVPYDEFADGIGPARTTR